MSPSPATTTLWLPCPPPNPCSSSSSPGTVPCFRCSFLIPPLGTPPPLHRPPASLVVFRSHFDSALRFLFLCEQAFPPAALESPHSSFPSQKAQPEESPSFSPGVSASALFSLPGRDAAIAAGAFSAPSSCSQGLPVSEKSRGIGENGPNRKDQKGTGTETDKDEPASRVSIPAVLLPYPANVWERHLPRLQALATSSLSTRCSLILACTYAALASTNSREVAAFTSVLSSLLHPPRSSLVYLNQEYQQVLESHWGSSASPCCPQTALSGPGTRRVGDWDIGGLCSRFPSLSSAFSSSPPYYSAFRASPSFFPFSTAPCPSPSDSPSSFFAAFLSSSLASLLKAAPLILPFYRNKILSTCLPLLVSLDKKGFWATLLLLLLRHVYTLLLHPPTASAASEAAARVAQITQRRSKFLSSFSNSQSADPRLKNFGPGSAAYSASQLPASQHGSSRSSDSLAGESKDISPTTHSLTVLRFLRQQLDHVCTHPPLAAAAFFICARLLLASTGGGSLQLVGREAESVVSGIWLRKEGRAGVCLLGGREVVRVMGELARLASVRRNVWPVLLQPPEAALLPLLVARAGSSREGTERRGENGRRRPRNRPAAGGDRRRGADLVWETADEALSRRKTDEQEGTKRTRAQQDAEGRVESRPNRIVGEEQTNSHGPRKDEGTALRGRTSEASSANSGVDCSVPSAKKRRTGPSLDPSTSAVPLPLGSHVGTPCLSSPRVVFSACCHCNTRCWREVEASRLDDVSSSNLRPTGSPPRSPSSSCGPELSIRGLLRRGTPKNDRDLSTLVESQDGLQEASCDRWPSGGLPGAPKTLLVAAQREDNSTSYSTPPSGSCSRSPSPTACPSLSTPSVSSQATESHSCQTGDEPSGAPSARQSEAILPGREEAQGSRGVPTQHSLPVPCRFCRRCARGRRRLNRGTRREERRGRREASLRLFLSRKGVAEKSGGCEDREATPSDSAALGSSCGPSGSKPVASSLTSRLSTGGLEETHLSSRVPLFDWLLALPPSTFLCSLLLPDEQVRDMHYLFTQLQLLSSGDALDVLQPSQKGSGSPLTECNSAVKTSESVPPRPSSTNSSESPARIADKTSKSGAPELLPFLIKAAAASQAFNFEAFHQNWLISTGISGSATNPGGGHASASSFSSSWFPPFASDILRLAVLLSGVYAVVEATATADASQLPTDPHGTRPSSSGPLAEGFRGAVPASPGEFITTDNSEVQENQSQGGGSATAGLTSAVWGAKQGEATMEKPRMLSKPAQELSVGTLGKSPKKVEGEEGQGDSCLSFPYTGRRSAKEAVLFHNVRISCPSVIFVRWLLVSIQQAVAFPFSVLVSAHTRLALCLDWLTFLPAHLLNPCCLRSVPDTASKCHTTPAVPAVLGGSAADASAPGQATTCEGARPYFQDAVSSQGDGVRGAVGTPKDAEGGTASVKSSAREADERSRRQEFKSMGPESRQMPCGPHEQDLWETPESCQAACEHTQQLLQLAAEGARAATTAARAAATAAASAFAAAQQQQQQMLFVGSGEKTAGVAAAKEKFFTSEVAAHGDDPGDFQGVSLGAPRSAVLEQGKRQNSQERKQGADSSSLRTTLTASRPRGGGAGGMFAGLLPGCAGRVGSGREERIAAAREAARETARRAAAALPKIWDATPFQDGWLYDAVVLPLLQFLLPCKQRQPFSSVQGDDGNEYRLLGDDSLQKKREELCRAPCFFGAESSPSGSARLARLLPFGSLLFQLVLDSATNPRDAAALLDFFGQTLASYSPSSLPLFLPSLAAALASFAVLQLLLLHGESPVPGALGRTRPPAPVLTAALQNQTLPGLLLRQAGLPVRVVYKRLGVSGSPGIDSGSSKGTHLSVPLSSAARGQEARGMPPSGLGHRDVTPACGVANQAGATLMKNHVEKGGLDYYQGSQPPASVGLETASISSAGGSPYPSDEDEAAVGGRKTCSSREKRMSFPVEAKHAPPPSGCPLPSPGRRRPSSTVSGSSVSDVASSRSSSVQSMPPPPLQRSASRHIPASQAALSCDFALHLGGGGGSAEKRVTVQIHPLLTHCCIAAVAMVAQIASRPRAYQTLSGIRWRPAKARNEAPALQGLSRIHEGKQRTSADAVRLGSQTKPKGSVGVPSPKADRETMDEVKPLGGAQAGLTDGRCVQASVQQSGLQPAGTSQQDPGARVSTKTQRGQEEARGEQVEPEQISSETGRARGTSYTATVPHDERQAGPPEKPPLRSVASDGHENDAVLSSSASSCSLSDSSVFSEEDTDDAALNDFFFRRARRDLCFPIEGSRLLSSCDCLGRRLQAVRKSLQGSAEKPSLALPDAPCPDAVTDRLAAQRGNESEGSGEPREEAARRAVGAARTVPRYRVPSFLQFETGTSLTARQADCDRRGRSPSYTAFEVHQRNSSLVLLNEWRDKMVGGSDATRTSALPRRVCSSTKGTRSHATESGWGLSAACACKPSGIWRCLLRRTSQPSLSLPSYVVSESALLSPLTRRVVRSSRQSEDTRGVHVGGQEERQEASQEASTLQADALKLSEESCGPCVAQGMATGGKQLEVSGAAPGKVFNRKGMRADEAETRLADFVREITRAVLQLGPPGFSGGDHLSGTGDSFAELKNKSPAEHCGSISKLAPECFPSIREEEEGKGYTASHSGRKPGSVLLDERVLLQEEPKTLPVSTIASLVARRLIKQLQEPGQNEAKAEQKEKLETERRCEGSLVDVRMLRSLQSEEGGHLEQAEKDGSGDRHHARNSASSAALSSPSSSILSAKKEKGCVELQKDSTNEDGRTQAVTELGRPRDGSADFSRSKAPSVISLLTAIADQLQVDWCTDAGTCRCGEGRPPHPRSTVTNACRALDGNTSARNSRVESKVSALVQGISRSDRSGTRGLDTLSPSGPPWTAGVLLWGAVLAEMAAVQRSPGEGDESKANEAGGLRQLPSSNSMPVGFAALWCLARAAGAAGSARKKRQSSMSGQEAHGDHQTQARKGVWEAVNYDCRVYAAGRLRLLLELYGTYVYLTMRGSGLDTARAVVDRDLTEGVAFLRSRRREGKMTREDTEHKQEESLAGSRDEETEFSSVERLKGEEETDCRPDLLAFFSGLYRLPSFAFPLFVGSPPLLEAVLHTSTAQELEQLAVRCSLTAFSGEGSGQTAAAHKGDLATSVAREGTGPSLTSCSLSTSFPCADRSSFRCSLCSLSALEVFSASPDAGPSGLPEPSSQGEVRERSSPISEDRTASDAESLCLVERERVLPFFTLPQWHDRARASAESQLDRCRATGARDGTFLKLARTILFPTSVFRPESFATFSPMNSPRSPPGSRPSGGGWALAKQGSCFAALRWRCYVLAWRLFAREMEMYHLLTLPSVDFLSRPLFPLRVAESLSREIPLRPVSGPRPPLASGNQAPSSGAEESVNGGPLSVKTPRTPLPSSLDSNGQKSSLLPSQRQPGLSSCEAPPSGGSVSSCTSPSAPSALGGTLPPSTEHGLSPPAASLEGVPVVSVKTSDLPGGTQVGRANPPQQNHQQNQFPVSSASSLGVKPLQGIPGDEMVKNPFVLDSVSRGGSILLWQTSMPFPGSSSGLGGILKEDVLDDGEGRTEPAALSGTAKHSGVTAKGLAVNTKGREDAAVSCDSEVADLPLSSPVFLLPCLALPKTSCTVGSLSPLLVQVLGSLFALLFKTQESVSPQSAALDFGPHGRSCREDDPSNPVVGMKAGERLGGPPEAAQEQRRSMTRALSVPFISLTPLMASLRPHVSLLCTVLLALARASPPAAPPGPFAHAELGVDGDGHENEATKEENLIVGALVTWLIRWYENDPCRAEQMILILKLQPQLFARMAGCRIHSFPDIPREGGIARAASGRGGTGGEEGAKRSEKQQKRRGLRGPEEEELELQRRIVAAAKKEEDEGLGLWSKVTVQVAAFATRHAAASFHGKKEDGEASSVVLCVRLPLLRLGPKKTPGLTEGCPHPTSSGASTSPPEDVKEGRGDGLEWMKARRLGDAEEEEVDQVSLPAVQRFCESLSAPAPQGTNMTTTTLCVP